MFNQTPRLTPPHLTSALSRAEENLCTCHGALAPELTTIDSLIGSALRRQPQPYKTRDAAILLRAHLERQDEGFDTQRQLTTARSGLGPERSMGRLDVFMSLNPCDLCAALSCRQPSRCSGLLLHSLLTVLTHLHGCIKKTCQRSLSEERQHLFFALLMFPTILNLKLVMIKSCD